MGMKSQNYKLASRKRLFFHMLSQWTVQCGRPLPTPDPPSALSSQLGPEVEAPLLPAGLGQWKAPEENQGE